jgi:hypothetical protein
MVASFEQRLRELGWIDGRGVAIVYRWADGKSDRFGEIATEFVGLKVDVILTAGSAVAAAGSNADSPEPLLRPRATGRRDIGMRARVICGYRFSKTADRIHNCNGSVIASSNRALSASDQWMPIRLPPTPTVMPLKARKPIPAML